MERGRKTQPGTEPGRGRNGEEETYRTGKKEGERQNESMIIEILCRQTVTITRHRH